MLIPQSCYQRWREIGAPHARALAIATGSRVPMPRVAAAAVVEQTSSAESLDLEPPKETAQEGDSLCQGPKGQKLVKLKRGRLYRMRKRVIQQAVKQTSSIRRQNLMEDLEHGVGMGSNSTAASSSAVEDAKPKAKAKANAKAVAASGEQKEEETATTRRVLRRSNTNLCGQDPAERCSSCVGPLRFRGHIDSTLPRAFGAAHGLSYGRACV